VPIPRFLTFPTVVSISRLPLACLPRSVRVFCTLCVAAPARCPLRAPYSTLCVAAPARCPLRAPYSTLCVAAPARCPLRAPICRSRPTEQHDATHIVPRANVGE
jgi:hypothetical protein